MRGEQQTHKEEEVKTIHQRIRESFTPYRKVLVSEEETKVKQALEFELFIVVGSEISCDDDINLKCYVAFD